MPFKSIGPLELVLILGVVLLIFGAGKLPGIGRAMGQSIKEFRKGFQGTDEEKAAPPEAVSKGGNGSSSIEH